MNTLIHLDAMAGEAAEDSPISSGLGRATP
jgi:hypothetical protein